MGGIKLKSPLRITEEYNRLMRESGVCFVNGSPLKGFSQLQDFLSVEELAVRLRWMDDRAFESILERLPDNLFVTMSRNDALCFQRLQSQSAPQKDGFPLPALSRPATWPLNKLIPAELRILQEKLKQIGIDKVLVGTEMEFTLAETPAFNNEKWLAAKKGMIENLERQALSAGHQERTRLLEKRQNLEKFSAREILMYDLVENNPRTMNILEPIFGTSRDGNGYYDSEGILELKLKPVAPEEQIQNRRIILSALYEKATEFGLIMEDMPSNHLSFSFWKEGNNIFNSETPTFMHEGKAAIEGITRSVYDFIPTLISKSCIDDPLAENVRCTPDREGFLRFASGRAELRPMTDAEEQDTDAYLAFVLAGALHGLTSGGADLLTARQAEKACFTHERGRCKVTTHVLGNSVIGKDGCLLPPVNYIVEHAETLAYELGMIEAMPEKLDIGGLKLFSQPPDYAAGLVEFFRQTKVDAKTGVAEFPVTEQGIYQIATPRDYIGFLPEPLRRKLENVRKKNKSCGDIGQWLSPRLEHEAFRYMLDNRLFAEAVKDPSNILEKYTINVNSLRQTVKMTGVTAALCIDPGYDTNQAQPGHSLRQTRLSRMLASPLLNEASPAFRESLRDAFAARYPEISAPASNSGMTRRPAF